MDKENQQVLFTVTNTDEFHISQLNRSIFSINLSPIIGTEEKEGTVKIRLGEEEVYGITFEYDNGIDIKDLCEGIEGIVKLIKEKYKIA